MRGRGLSEGRPRPIEVAPFLATRGISRTLTQPAVQPLTKKGENNINPTNIYTIKINHHLIVLSWNIVPESCEKFSSCWPLTLAKCTWSSFSVTYHPTVEHFLGFKTFNFNVNQWTVIFDIYPLSQAHAQMHKKYFYYSSLEVPASRGWI